MNTGNRKMVAFIIAIITITAIIITAMFVKGINFTGDNIERLCWIIFFLALTFTGGNAAEWLAKMKTGGTSMESSKTTETTTTETK